MTEQIEKKKSLVPGFFLIFIGLWLLSKNTRFMYNQWEYVYPCLILLFSALFFIEASRKNHTNTLFWAVTFLGIGSFFVLRNFGIVEYYYWDDYWPVFLISVGLGFLTLFVINPRDWGSLIPAALCLFFGFGFAMTNLFHVFWDFEIFIDAYWPVILIFFGIGLMLSGVFKRKA